MAGRSSTRGQFTAEFRALRADGVGALDGRPRPAWSPTPAASRCASSAPSSTSPTPAGRPSSGSRRSTARPRSPRSRRSWPTRPASRTSPEIVQRGAQVLGAQSSALAIFDPGGGPLRLHMTNRLTDEVQEHVDYPVAGVEIELDDGQPTQYAAMHGRRVLLANREEASPVSPPSREGLDVLNISAVAALPLRVEGRDPRLVRRRCGATAHPFASDDVEVLEALAAQIALSVSRLQADARARRGGRRDGRGEPAAADARRDRADPVRHAGDRRADRAARRARRPRARRLVLDRGHRRAGPAARAGLGAPRPVPAGPRSRPTCGRWSR